MTDDQANQIITLLTEQTSLTRALLDEARKGGNAPSPSDGWNSGRQPGGSLNRRRDDRDGPPDEDTPRGEWCDLVMPFGKHKGMKLSQCPKSYLDYFLKQLESGEMRAGTVREAIEDYKRCRCGSNLTVPRDQQGRVAPPRMPQNSGGSGGFDDDVPF